jgi:hypothetical protein
MASGAEPTARSERAIHRSLFTTAPVAGSVLASRGLANYNQAAIDRDEIE